MGHQLRHAEDEDECDLVEEGFGRLDLRLGRMGGFEVWRVVVPSRSLLFQIFSIMNAGVGGRYLDHTRISVSLVPLLCHSHNECGAEEREMIEVYTEGMEMRKKYLIRSHTWLY